jgi:hypothetical protein
MSGRTSERDPVTNRFVKRDGNAANGDGSDGGPIDPEIAAGAGEPGEPDPRPRRRGRPRGSGGDSGGAGAGTRKTRTKAGASLDLSAFTGIWCGLHLQIAQLTENPELAITEADGKAFLTALQNVMRHYPLTASQKAVDWAALAFISSFIYVPRFAAVAKRRGASVPGRATETATVFQFNQPSQRPNGQGSQSDFAPPPPIPPTVDMSIEPEMETVDG